MSDQFEHSNSCLFLNRSQIPFVATVTDWTAEMADAHIRACWSVGIDNARYITHAAALLADYMDKTTEEVVNPDGVKSIALKVAGRSHFVKFMRDFMIEEGMADVSEFKNVNQDDVTDFRSLARLNLIFDTHVRQTYGFRQWKQGTTPAVLRAFPAARLIRERGVREPRPRHQAALGTVKSKLDPWWAEVMNDPEIGGFGVPWGPYGFGSGVNQEDVSREEATRLGVCLPPSEPVKVDPNSKLAVLVKNMNPDVKAKLLEELRTKRASLGNPIEDAKQGACEAAANTRRIMLTRGLDDAIRRGDYELEQKYRASLEELRSTSD